MNVSRRTLSTFLRKVFQDMKIMCFRDEIVNYSNDELYDAFMKQLNVFHTAFHPMHIGDFEVFFTSVEITCYNMRSLLISHCCKILKEPTNIFTLLMYVYSFAFSLIDFCGRRTGQGYYIEVYKFIKREFIHKLAQRFDDEGAWEGLRKFCSPHKLLEILDFINACYSKKAMLLTLVEIELLQPDDALYYHRVENSRACIWQDFGVHNERTLASLEQNLRNLKRLIFRTYGEEISGYPYFTRMIEISFLRMSRALADVARHLDTPRKTLTCPLLDFLNTYLREFCHQLSNENTSVRTKIF